MQTQENSSVQKNKGKKENKKKGPKFRKFKNELWDMLIKHNEQFYLFIKNYTT